MTKDCLYIGSVFHKRYVPKRHELRYRVFTLFADLDQLDEISVATMLRAKTAAKKRVAKAEEEGDEPTVMKRSAQAAKFDTAAKKKYAQNK